MLAEIGHFALILAVFLNFAQAAVGLLGAGRIDFGLMYYSRRAALLSFAAVAVSFAMLMLCFAQSDFSVALVANYSQTQMPLAYKLSGVWANHEGSMMLWMLVFSLFTACIAFFDAGLPDVLRTRVLAVQGLIGFCFLAFILLTSNPFVRLSPAPIEGNGINPILQDPGLAFHPPLLYLGYVGFSVTFSFAVAALLEGRVEPAWARWVRPWALASLVLSHTWHHAWQFLGLLHIGLGRMVVLGSGGECLAAAVAHGHGTSAFSHRC